MSDQVLMVGAHTHKSRATKAEIDAGKFVAFENVEDLSKYVKATAIENESHQEQQQSSFGPRHAGLGGAGPMLAKRMRHFNRLPELWSSRATVS